MLACTFRPLKRGRLACIQTGVIVKKAKTDPYRNSLLSGNRSPSASVAPRIHEVVIGTWGRQRRARCPTCHVRYDLRFARGEFSCDCGTRIKVTWL